MNPRTRSQTPIRRDSGRLRCLAAGLLVVVLAACSNLPPPPEIDASADRFSPERARAHYAALAGIGTRPPGIDATERARAYLARELRWAGAELDPGQNDDADGSLVARLPGPSSDRVLVVAPWVPVGAQSGVDDAGVAILLELARALSRNAPPYTVVLVAAEVALSEPSAADARRTREAVREAGAGLIRRIEAKDGLRGLRAVLVLEPRAVEGTRVARDLRSHPVFRDLFWRTAARLGHADAFPSDAHWATPEGIQGAFLSAGYGQVLSLVEVGTDRPAPSEDGRPAGPGPGAFEPVGTVAYEGLVQLMRRLERIDAFSQ